MITLCGHLLNMHTKEKQILWMSLLIIKPNKYSIVIDKRNFLYFNKEKNKCNKVIDTRTTSYLTLTCSNIRMLYILVIQMRTDNNITYCDYPPLRLLLHSHCQEFFLKT